MEFVSKTDFQRYLMIVKSTGIISPATIRSQNVLNFGYALYLLLRSKGEDAAIIEKVVRWWMVLTTLTGRYSESPQSTFDYDIKWFQAYDTVIKLNVSINDEVLLWTLLISLPTNYYCELLDEFINGQTKKERTYGTK